jgi:hypothetical protein
VHALNTIKPMNVGQCIKAEIKAELKCIPFQANALLEKNNF